MRVDEHLGAEVIPVPSASRNRVNDFAAEIPGSRKIIRCSLKRFPR
jgi:hypothetical protein